MRRPSRDCAGAQGRGEGGRREWALSARSAGRGPRPIRNSVVGVPPYSAPDACALSQEHLATRPQYLPVLWSGTSLGRIDARSRGTAFARWLVELGEPGSLLPSLQSSERESAPQRSPDEAAARTAGLQSPHQPAHHAIDGAVG